MTYKAAYECVANRLAVNFTCTCIDVCPEEDCSPAVETSAFDDEFVKPICGW